MWGEDRSSLRQMFTTAWQDFEAGKPLDKQAQMIADVVAIHPEYHAAIGSGGALEKEFDGSDGQSNPFLHMAMHIAVREQLSVDRPPGVVKIHRKLTNRLGDLHEAEHQMVESLAETLWNAQQNNQEPDIEDYVRGLKKRLKVL